MPRGDLRDLEQRVRRLERLVDQMTKADEIAAGVAAELDRRALTSAPVETRPQFTWPVKIGTALAGIVLTLDTVAGWLK